MARQIHHLDKHKLEHMTLDSEHYIKRYSKLRELYYRLMIVDGKYIYLDPTDSAYWIDRLLENGEYIYPNLVSYDISKRCQLEPFMCYQNVLQVYPAGFPKRKLKVYIGYSLMTLENCWLQHTWMYDGEVIYESTPIESTRYYGIPTTIEELRAWMDTYRWRLPPNPDL